MGPVAKPMAKTARTPTEVETLEAACNALAAKVAALELELREVLAQKETQLREVHHRVKNSMQIVTSLLNLHAHQIEEPAAGAAFAAAQERINALAAIHGELYAADNLESIDLKQFLAGLLVHVSRAGATPNCKVTLAADLASESIPAMLALPFGMLIMEIIGAAVRGADANVTSRIRVAFARIDPARVMTTIHYEGMGEGVAMDWEASSAPTSNLGQTLAAAYVRQLNGDLRVESVGSGSVLYLRMALPEPS